MRRVVRHSSASATFYFNPRTREGCDPAAYGAYELGKRISIHAPVKGATVRQELVYIRTVISIHAPVKGATWLCSSLLHIRQNFNPRTREGCDKLSSKLSIQFVHFNPRTREGCDLTCACNYVPIVDFNPRTREGCDDFFAFSSSYTPLFQSTHP